MSGGLDAPDSEEVPRVPRRLPLEALRPQRHHIRCPHHGGSVVHLMLLREQLSHCLSTTQLFPNEAQDEDDPEVEKREVWH